MWAPHMGCLLQPAEPDKHTSMRVTVWEQGMILAEILCVDRMGGTRLWRHRRGTSCIRWTLQTPQQSRRSWQRRTSGAVLAV